MPPLIHRSSDGTLKDIPRFKPGVVVFAIGLSNVYLSGVSQILVPLLFCSVTFMMKNQCTTPVTDGTALPLENDPEQPLMTGPPFINNQPAKAYLVSLAALVHACIISETLIDAPIKLDHPIEALTVQCTIATIQNILCVFAARKIKRCCEKEESTIDEHHQQLMQLMTPFCFLISVTQAIHAADVTPAPTTVVAIASPFVAIAMSYGILIASRCYLDRPPIDDQTSHYAPPDHNESPPHDHIQHSPLEPPPIRNKQTRWPSLASIDAIILNQQRKIKSTKTIEDPTHVCKIPF